MCIIFFVTLFKIEPKNVARVLLVPAWRKKGTCRENDCRMALQQPLSSEFVRFGCWAGIDKKMNTGCSLISKRWDHTREKSEWRWYSIWSRLGSNANLANVWMSAYIPNTAYDAPLLYFNGSAGCPHV